MIKLFVADMDGTLLNEEHLISDRVADGIRALQAHGVEFLIATGRGYRSAYLPLLAHQLKPKLITLNGSMRADWDGTPDYVYELNPKAVETMITYLDERDIKYSIMTQNYNYMSDHTFFEEIIEEMFVGKTDPDSETAAQFQVDREFIRDIDEYKPGVSELPVKIMVLSSDPNVQKDFIAKFEDDETIDITSSGPGNLEITDYRGQKGRAIMDYAKERGIQPNEVLTIGDSLNDRSMLKMFEWSFAMDNASDEVKRFANYTAPSNEQGIDGVAVIMENVIKGKYQSHI